MRCRSTAMTRFCHPRFVTQIRSCFDRYNPRRLNHDANRHERRLVHFADLGFLAPSPRSPFLIVCCATSHAGACVRVANVRLSERVEVMVWAAEAPRASVFCCAQTSDSTEHYDLKLAPTRRSEEARSSVVACVVVIATGGFPIACLGSRGRVSKHTLRFGDNHQARPCTKYPGRCNRVHVTTYELAKRRRRGCICGLRYLPRYGDLCGSRSTS